MKRSLQTIESNRSTIDLEAFKEFRMGRKFKEGRSGNFFPIQQRIN
jgi:hypothetical protein